MSGMGLLVEAVWDEWERARGLHGEWLPVEGGPLLWNGDRRVYEASRRRVVTVGVNPGPSVFPEDDPWGRCPGLSVGRGDVDGYESVLNGMELDRWFSGWCRVLDPLGVMFGGGPQGSTLHLDLSPVPTRVVVSKCPKIVDEDLMRHGMPLLAAAVDVLRPQVVVVSVSTPRWEALKDSVGIVEEERWDFPRRGGRKHTFARGRWPGGHHVLWVRKVSMAPVSPGRAACREVVERCLRVWTSGGKI